MPGSPVNLKTLREQVYEYLRDAMNRGDLVPGGGIDLEEIGARLGISRTPLRFALLQLENEGFVTILPRRGCVVRTLTVEDIRRIYQIVGALEASVLRAEFHRLGGEKCDRMRWLNEQLRSRLEEIDFAGFHRLNYEFHDTYLSLSSNTELLRIVKTLKRRLYDFPTRQPFPKDWALSSTGEHARLVDLIGAGDAAAAAEFLQNVHWSYDVQKHFVHRRYGAEMASPGTRPEKGSETPMPERR